MRYVHNLYFCLNYAITEEAKKQIALSGVHYITAALLSEGFLIFFLREIYNYCTGFMNTRSELLCLPDDIVVQRAR